MFSMRLLIFIVILLIGKNVYSDSSLPPQTISRIETGWGNEGIYLAFAENNLVEGCSYTAAVFQHDHPMLKNILSIALSAFHSGKRVQVRVSGCFDGRHNGVAIAVLH
jgi:hypothetical protein